MGTAWDRKPILPFPVSIPPVGKCRVVNIYVDPETSIVVVEYDDIPIK